MKLVWNKAKDGLGHEAYLGDYKVSRVTCQSGRRFYYLHYVTRYIKSGNCQWHMSDKAHSLTSIRALLNSFKTEQGIETLGELALKREFSKVGV